MSSACSLSKLQQAVNRFSVVQHTCRLASAALRSVILHIGLSLQVHTSLDHSVPMANVHSVTHDRCIFPGSHTHTVEDLSVSGPILTVSVAHADGYHAMLRCDKAIKGCIHRQSFCWLRDCGYTARKVQT